MACCGTGSGCSSSGRDMKQGCHDGPITPPPIPPEASFVISLSLLWTDRHQQQHKYMNDDQITYSISTSTTPPSFPKTVLYHPETIKQNSHFAPSMKFFYYMSLLYFMYITHFPVVTSFSIRPTAFVFPNYYHDYSYRNSYTDRSSSSSCATAQSTFSSSTSPVRTTRIITRRHMLEDPNIQFISTIATAATSVMNMVPPSDTTYMTHDTTGSSISHFVQHIFATYLFYLDHYSLFTQAVTAAFFAGLGDALAQSIASQQNQIQRRVLDDDVSNQNYNDIVSIHHIDNISIITPNVDVETSLPSTSTVTPVEGTKSSSSYDVQRTMHYVFKGLGGGCMWSVWFSYSDPISLDLTQRLLESVYNTFFLPTQTEVGYATLNGEIDVATAVSHVLSTQLPFLAVPGCTLQHIIHVVVCIVLEQFFVSPFFYTVWDIPVPALMSGSPIRQIPAQIQAKLVPLLIANAKVWTPANVITYSLPSEYRVLFASMTDVIWQTILSEITSNEITLEPPPPPKVAILPSSLLVSPQEVDSVSAMSHVEQNGTGRSESIVTSTTASIPAPTITATTVFQSNMAQD